MAFIGSGVGAIIASKKEKIIINGDINNYKNKLERLPKYSNFNQLAILPFANGYYPYTTLIGFLDCR